MSAHVGLRGSRRPGSSWYVDVVEFVAEGRRAATSRFGGHRFGEGRHLRFPPVHLVDLPILLPLAVAQAPIALGLLLARDLVRKLAP
jgi:hypothetical protein